MARFLARLLIMLSILLYPTNAYATYDSPYHGVTHTYNIYTDSPHTHAGLVKWVQTLPYPWPQIVGCESLSDDSWRESSPSNARGVFQFLRSSWARVGGSGDPAAASWREQYYRARLLRKMDGIRSWVCARITGVI